MEFADIKMRPTRPDDYCTKSTACKPAAGEPTMFLAFLDKIMGGDKEMIAYLRRVFGYCCTGSTKEHVMFFFFGTGANGKSVLLSTIAGILGDYHKTAPIETFTEQHGSTSHPTELAGFMGARLVTAIETEEGRRWNESRIKALTGGDKISARFMRQDFFEFTPQFKLIVAGNRKPSLRTVDEAMRRRLHMVPFSVTIPPEERDLDLAEKLKAEWPKILTWMIMGCREWYEIGLRPPAAVIDATDEYFEAEDAISNWIEDRCELKPRNWEASGLLFASWKSWAEAASEPVGSQKAFSQKLVARADIIPEKSGHAKTRGFRGICLLENA
jgi:putative DNA primase/helicase